jgi:hypothetical protein
MLVAAILNNEPQELAPKSFQGNYQGNERENGRDATVEHKRNRGARPQSKSKKGSQGKSHDPYSPAESNKDILVNEIIAELGPLSSEEEDRIREWLKLGS